MLGGANLDTDSFVKFMHDIDDDKKCFLMNVYTIYRGCKDITVSKDVGNITEVGKYIKKWNSCSVDDFIESLYAANKSAAIITHQILNGADKDTFGVSECLFGLLRDITRNSRFASIANFMECEFGYEDIAYGCDCSKNKLCNIPKDETHDLSKQLENIKRLTVAAKRELGTFMSQFNETMKTSLYPELDPEGIQKFRTECSLLDTILEKLSSDSIEGYELNGYDSWIAEHCNNIKNARYDWLLGNLGKNLLDRLFMLVSAIGCGDVSVLAEIDMRRAAYGTAEWDKEVKG